MTPQMARTAAPATGAKTVRAVLFDMDGTLLDTLGDLTDSLNHVLAARGHRHDFTVRDVARFFGSGASVAMQRALAAARGVPMGEAVTMGASVLPVGREPLALSPADRAEAETLRQLYAPYYHAHCREKTAPYAGIPELLRRLRRAGLRLAVVSNKGDSEVRELADALFPGCFDCALGVRPERRRKPAPDMIRLALDSLGVAASDALYVGDSEVDLETAARSGLACVSVDWGFRDHDFLVRAGAARIVSDPEALAACLLA